MSYLEKVFDSYAKKNRIELVAEYKFHPTRKWRFDFANVSEKIAIEIEGGIYSQGRHTRGSGFRNDTIKYNQATILGWRVLRYCSIKDIVDYFLQDYNELRRLS